LWEEKFFLETKAFKGTASQVVSLKHHQNTTAFENQAVEYSGQHQKFNLQNIPLTVDANKSMIARDSHEIELERANHNSEIWNNSGLISGIFIMMGKNLF